MKTLRSTEMLFAESQRQLFYQLLSFAIHIIDFRLEHAVCYNICTVAG